MNNSVFGKAMKNIRKPRNFRFVTTDKKEPFTYQNCSQKSD